MTNKNKYKFINHIFGGRGQFFTFTFLILLSMSNFIKLVVG